MFCWYGSAAKCYVYLDDVYCPATGDGDHQIKQQLRRSRWFTRGWTLQEVIAPKTVEFFSKEGAFLGDKQSLEQPLCDITSIPARALRGDPLPGFTVAERMAWAERRETTRPEDRAYSLLGIFHVQMPLIYGEGEQNASRRLREEITKSQKGIQHEDFAAPFSLHGMPEIEYFVAREQELAEMRNALTSDGSRRVVVLHGLGGMGKTQLAIAYTKQHKDNYSAIFWINIKDEDSLKQSFVRIAYHIKRYHPSASRIGSIDIQKDLDETIDAVKAWLSLPDNLRWLLVYNNYDNPKLPSTTTTEPTAIDIRKYFPKAYQRSIIITTRSSQVKISHTLQMAKLRNLDNSLEILRTTSKRQDLTEDPDAR
ncbi:P-loop containing nucleoside triphosphate hydrolase protein [Xylariaceae sp. FL0255]|nr:P-loop containing nucleoside triphosphate hydrolase protein [Xylariaceae sp. FL0255]